MSTLDPIHNGARRALLISDRFDTGIVLARKHLVESRSQLALCKNFASPGYAPSCLGLALIRVPQGHQRQDEFCRIQEYFQQAE